jgi:hypothetical protein
MKAVIFDARFSEDGHLKSILRYERHLEEKGILQFSVDQIRKHLVLGSC